MSKPIYIIDGDSFSSLPEFYEEIGNKLIPGVDWGKNLDALSDILAGGFGTPEEGFTLIWKHSELSRQYLGYPATATFLERAWSRWGGKLSYENVREADKAHLRRIHSDWTEQQLIEEANRYEGGNVSRYKRLEAARKGQGPTIFDWIISIINEYPEIELLLE
jgi:RNAse (barnase) inhibitor barstar